MSMRLSREHNRSVRVAQGYAPCDSSFTIQSERALHCGYWSKMIFGEIPVLFQWYDVSTDVLRLKLINWCCRFYFLIHSLKVIKALVIEWCECSNLAQLQQLTSDTANGRRWKVHKPLPFGQFVHLQPQKPWARTVVHQQKERKCTIL